MRRLEEEEEARKEEGGQEHSEAHGREAKEKEEEEEARARGLTMEWEVKKERVKVEKGENVTSVDRQVTEPGTVQTKEVCQEEGRKEKEKAKTIRG